MKALFCICLISIPCTTGVVNAQTALNSDGGRKDKRVVQLEVDGKKIGLEKHQVVKMKVDAARPPVPALKYRLYPSIGSQKKGDAATLYHRAILFFRQNNSSKDYRQNLKRKERGEKIPFAEQTFDELAEIQPESLSSSELEELKNVVESQGEVIMNELRLAENLEECDWGFGVNQGRPLLEYISFLLPEMQEFRGIARYLALRSKVQIASGDVEGALDTIRTGLKMSKTTEDTRFMVCSLIGVACSSVMMGQVEQLIASKDSPNLYWALEVLPRPLVSVKPAIRQELEFLRNGAGMKIFQNPESAEMTVEQWNRTMAQGLKNLTELIGTEYMGPRPDAQIRKIQMLGILLRGYPIAKRKLVSWGFDADKVEAMPVAQVVAIHESRMLQVVSDEIQKCLNLDTVTAKKHIKKITDGLMKPPTRLGDLDSNQELVPIASTMLPATNAVLEAEQRILRKVKILQTVEALRVHAAIHKDFPDKLEEIKDVPLPLNPDTNKSFFYRRTARGCEVWEKSPDTSVSDPLFFQSKVYQIELRK